MNTYALIGILKFKNNLQNFSMSPIKSFMAWYNATGKEKYLKEANAWLVKIIYHVATDKYFFTDPNFASYASNLKKFWR